MNNKAIYPGTFDPITNGHLDIINRSVDIFEHVIIGVAKNEGKHPLFSLEKRVELIYKALEKKEYFNRIEICGFDCLLSHFAKDKKVSIIIRGLRAVSDFEYELQMGYANTSLDNKLDTIYFMPSLKNAFISSSIVRQILHYGGDASHLVPPETITYL